MLHMLRTRNRNRVWCEGCTEAVGHTDALTFETTLRIESKVKQSNMPIQLVSECIKLAFRYNTHPYSQSMVPVPNISTNLCISKEIIGQVAVQSYLYSRRGLDP